MNNILRRAVTLSVIIGIATAVGVMAQGGGVARGGAAAPPPPAPAAPAQTGFPDGPGKALVEGNCGGCHDLDLVKSAKHDEKGWAETVGHMVTYGAALTDAQVPTVATYLAKSFPVAGAAPKPDDAKAAAERSAAGEKILNTACTTCHDLGVVTRRADDKATWEGIVYGMVGNGADVKEAEIPILVEYLVNNYGPPKPATTAPAPPRGGGAPARGGAPAGR